MLRALWYIFLLCVLAVVTMWMADHPGRVNLTWEGYVIDTSAAVLVSGVAFFVMLTALLYRFWLFLKRAPASLSRHRKDSRRRRGYLALSRGMVAVAAGDTTEAGRQSRRADNLLEEPSLTMLLSAQAAQLEGDEEAAAKFFTRMLDAPEMEFLGLRGLLNQAIKAKNNPEALKLTRRAYGLKPDSDWVARTLVDLSTREGLWAEADDALAVAVRKKQLSAAEARRPRAVLALQISLEAEAAGDMDKAISWAKKASADAPDFVPAQVHYANVLNATNKRRKAVLVLEAAWTLAPHPDVAKAYWGVNEADDAMARMKAAQKLARFKPDDPATNMMLACAALDANLWGDARKNLQAISSTDTPLSARFCRVMADLEEAEHGDMMAAREWLVRATHAEADLAWVCSECGNAVESWTALCGRCGGFDTFEWRHPPRVPGLIGREIHPLDVPQLADHTKSEKGGQNLTAPKGTQDIDAESPSQ